MAPDALLRDGHVVLNLPRKGRAHLLQRDGVCKLDDVADVQQLAVLRRLHHLVGKRAVDEQALVAADGDDVRVRADDADIGLVPASADGHLNVKRAAGVRFPHGDLRG